MKKIKLTYMAVAIILAASACSEDTIHSGNLNESDGRSIILQVGIPDIAQSRGQEYSSASSFDSIMVSSFYPEDITSTSPYFQNEKFRKRSAGNYTPARVINCLWPNQDGTLKFFAFYPPVDRMKDLCRDDIQDLPPKTTQGEDDNNFPDKTDKMDPYFVFDNTTTLGGSQLAIGYSIGKFRVSRDISKQSDFMAAYGSGVIPKINETAPTVNLPFDHKLSRIKVQAVAGTDSEYSFEIAGIRIGNPVVEGNYIFADSSDASKTDTWNLSQAKKGSVQYTFTQREPVISLTSTEQSIMGNGGNAMVIPAEIGKWVRPADPKNVEQPYTTDKMYFSVLLRAVKEDGEIAYPYPDGSRYPGMKVTYLAVDKDNRIIAEVDKDYIAKEGETVKEFGWAAVPAGVKWEAGKSYLYTLDYSKGIGYHDPEDPEPGTPIVEESGEVTFTVALTPWEDGEDTSVDLPSSSDDTTK